MNTHQIRLLPGEWFAYGLLLVGLLFFFPLWNQYRHVTTQKPGIYPVVTDLGDRKAWFYLKSSSTNVNPNDTFEVKVYLANNSELNPDSPSGTGSFNEGITAADISLTFDPAVLEAQDTDGNAANGIQASPGAVFVSDPASGSYTQNLIENESGTGYIAGFTHQDDATFPYNSQQAENEEDKIFATIVFKVKADAPTGGITQIGITGTNDNADTTNVLTDIQANLDTDILNQATTPHFGYQKVGIGVTSCIEDVSEDGIVDMYDLNGVINYTNWNDQCL